VALKAEISTHGRSQRLLVDRLNRERCSEDCGESIPKEWGSARGLDTGTP
jgi:hypothetical protein